MSITIACLAIMIAGIILINYSEHKFYTIGNITIGESEAIIQTGDNKMVLSNSNYKIRLSKAKYKGQSNYQPPLRIGAFTSSSGINEIQFYKGEDLLRFDILITSLGQLNMTRNSIQIFNK